VATIPCEVNEDLRKGPRRKALAGTDALRINDSTIITIPTTGKLGVIIIINSDNKKGREREGRVDTEDRQVRCACGNVPRRAGSSLSEPE
jgi:hypothetical protein